MCRLNKFLHAIGVRLDTLCRKCFNADEDIDHIIIHCDHYSSMRRQALGKERINYDDINNMPTRRLLNFMRISKLYDSFFFQQQ